MQLLMTADRTVVLEFRIEARPIVQKLGKGLVLTS